ncbi:expansin EXLX1 family cellulose-binding protein [Aquimarina algiphila]|uniref:expansin EXLX1 family cellulose-binding protein n=1 Tax=Aquimarina algiphila TaxID=2047982 RepID=UPI00248F554E|nr:expansin EXLX1 family cellulose-binding protein [Aquimarina algiphila]
MKLKFLIIIAYVSCYVNCVAQCNDSIKSGEATFYGGVAGSEGGNCSLPVAADDFMHCALNNTDYDGSNACGACLEITGSLGKTIVKVVDRCPECKPGDVDLTQQAFSEVANPIDGRVPITWKFVPCPLAASKTIKVNFKSGSTKYWTAIQFRDLKHAVSKMEYLKDNAWVNVERKLFNFFIEPAGIESPMQLRITSSVGEELILKDIVINTNTDFDTKMQFSTPPNCGGEPSQEPIASFTATPEMGVAPLEVSFDGTSSSDPNGDSITYAWDFGNGETSTLATPKVTFTEIKTYTVSLTVSDGTNTSVPVTQDIVVSDNNIAPVADFTATPTLGIAPVTVSFDASASSDANGDTLTYTWDFGDGNTGSGITVVHEYITVGKYTAILTVSDGSKTGTKTTTINVTDGNGGVSCAFGTPTTEALPAINSAFENIYVIGNGGPNLDNATNFTINWDLANNGLYQFSLGTNNGIPDWYINLLPKITQNFNTTKPSITITDSGFTGLDGAYWTTVDTGNFVLVSKTGGFTIYFSKETAAPNCEGTLPLTAFSVETFNNPVQDKLVIKGEDILTGTSVSLINISGVVLKTIQVQSNSKEVELNTANLESGMYFVKINYEQREKTLRIIRN